MKKTYGKKEKEISDRLTKIGINKCTAKVMSFFITNEKGKTIEIEQIVGLRQPEVSNATKELISAGVICCKKVPQTNKNKGKGRPENIYERKGSRNDYIETIVQRIEQQQQVYVNTIDYLHNLQ